MCRAEECTYPLGGVAFFARFEKSWEHEERANGYWKDSTHLVLPNCLASPSPGLYFSL